MEKISNSTPAFLTDIILRPNSKVFFFIFLGLMSVAVFLFVELPLITVDDAAHQRLLTMKWLLFPHIIFGLAGFIIGPFQFSTRLRKYNLRLHRRLGKIYVFTVCLAAFSAVLLNLNYPIPGQTSKATFEIIMQASVWFITTLMAWITAMRKQITLHKIWMSRSYGVTFIFISSRIIFFIPFFQNMDFDTFSIFLWFLIVVALIVPEIILNWKLVFSRAKKKIQ